MARGCRLPYPREVETVPCADCGAAIQAATARRTDGRCMPCDSKRAPPPPPPPAAPPCPLCETPGDFSSTHSGHGFCQSCQTYYALPGIDSGRAPLEGLGPKPGERPSAFDRLIRPYLLAFNQVRAERVDDGFRLVWRTPSLIVLGLLAYFAYWECRFLNDGPDLWSVSLVWGIPTYLLLANAVNRVTVTASGGRFSYRFGPLPYPGNFDVTAAAVKGFPWDLYAPHGCGTFAPHFVYAALRGRKKKALLVGNVPHSGAESIACALQAWLDAAKGDRPPGLPSGA